ncbi:ATP-dependent DNA helicase pif1-like [Aphidius gifuensis]|uniref:ATP-dependent DNA helicase pif1-like n=1 Tax=Aphidius gifuensis TaxID=684658 RepID=UPI001CDB5A84|nr:ATP-dependent DNA helicase pif1-like [Aphidius gifuensis]
MYSVSPAQTELFHLRLLLICTKGATSYENLRTVDGIVHETYVSTCLALGLIEDDNEWKNAMHEAEVWMMPLQLRQLFVRILLHCHPIHPEELWEEFKDALSQDYSRSMPLHQAHRTAYIKINTLLQNERSSLKDFPSMSQITEIENDDTEISLEQHKDTGSRQYELLNDEQKAVVDTILKRAVDVNSTASKCFFINGPGGSGKTYIHTTLYHLLRSLSKNVSTMAYTGIAATLLPGGKTVHETFKIPIALYSDSSLTITAQSKEADYCRKMDVIMWDEAPMSPKYALEFVDRTLRDVMNKDEPFGGKILILGGDFRQLLPVKKNATRGEFVDLSIKFTHLWPYFTEYTLTKNMRTRPGEVEFSKYLLTVGDGTANYNDSDLNLPDHCIAPREADIAEDVDGQVIKNKEYGKLENWAILSAGNVDVDDINMRVVELLDKSTEKIYSSINSIKNCDNGDISETLLPEFLETLNPSNLPPHKLRLRQNTVVMLIRNLSVNEGLCNGTRLQVLDCSNHLLR